MSNELIRRDITARENREYSFGRTRCSLKKSLVSTMRMTSTAMEGWTAHGKPHLRPDELVGRLNEKLRKQKEDERILREKILRESVDMAASRERKAALVFRFLEEKKRSDGQVALARQRILEKQRLEGEKTKMRSSMKSTSNMTKTMLNSKRYDYYHPGAWMKTLAHDREMWTCCASEDREGRVRIGRGICRRDVSVWSRTRWPGSSRNSRLFRFIYHPYPIPESQYAFACMLVYALRKSM